MRRVVVDSGTALTRLDGVGPLVAARILAEAGSVRRFATKAKFAAANGTAPIPASSGRTSRHRLNRGGNRRLNCAIHIAALSQMRPGRAGHAYLQRKQAEGKPVRAALRCLKRRISDAIYRQLQGDLQASAYGA